MPSETGFQTAFVQTGFAAVVASACDLRIVRVRTHTHALFGFLLPLYLSPLGRFTFRGRLKKLKTLLSGSFDLDIQPAFLLTPAEIRWSVCHLVRPITGFKAAVVHFVFPTWGFDNSWIMKTNRAGQPESHLIFLTNIKK
ncbi:hypothetical protein [Neisseria sp.]|uniref:hypothetical protein n=1 Tax=Neisseria sp. TaxID=192066 RepID=UPI0026DD2BEF|nr:hypothetical protein [Neisseria sp.]MDO4907914.1 hypothetical protein [Neisseria sp.]